MHCNRTEIKVMMKQLLRLKFMRHSVSPTRWVLNRMKAGKAGSLTILKRILYIGMWCKLSVETPTMLKRDYMQLISILSVEWLMTTGWFLRLLHYLKAKYVFLSIILLYMHRVLLIWKFIWGKRTIMLISRKVHPLLRFRSIILNIIVKDIFYSM